MTEKTVSFMDEVPKSLAHFIADLPWRTKCHVIIGRLSRASYLQANRLPNGTMRKRHVPYSVPDAARDLVECLDTNDEERAKAIFLYSYEVQA